MVYIREVFCCITLSCVHEDEDPLVPNGYLSPLKPSHYFSDLSLESY